MQYETLFETRRNYHDGCDSKGATERKYALRSWVITFTSGQLTGLCLEGIIDGRSKHSDHQYWCGGVVYWIYITLRHQWLVIGITGMKTFTFHLPDDVFDCNQFCIYIQWCMNMQLYPYELNLNDFSITLWVKVQHDLNFSVLTNLFQATCGL